MADKLPKFAVIILAAGNSTRMGAAKQLLDFRGKPMLRHAAEIAKLAGGDPVIVVLGANESEFRAALAGLDVEIAVNDRWPEGMGTSIHTGLRALENRDISGAILALADQPFVTPEFLSELVARHCEDAKPIVAAQYSVPPGFPCFSRARPFPC